MNIFFRLAVGSLSLAILLPLTGCGPVDAVDLTQKAQIYIKHNEYDGAIEVLQKSLDSDFENPAAHYYLGRCFLAQNKIEKAIYEFSLAVRFAPSMEIAHLDLISTLHRDDQVDRSIQATKIFLKNHPGAARDFIRIAEDFAAQGMIPQTVLAYEKAQDVEPSNPAPSLALAEFYFQQQDQENAAQALVRAFKIDPAYPGLAKRLGTLNYRVEIPQPTRPQPSPLEQELKQMNK